MYEKVIQFFSIYFARELNMNSKEKDRIRFGLEVLISTLISFFSTMILAFFLGYPLLTFFILLSGGVLKTVSGGVHFETVFECALFTAFTSNILGFFANHYIDVLYLYRYIFSASIFGFVFLSLLLWSPGEISGRTITDSEKRKKMKRLSLSIFFLITLLVLFLFKIYPGQFIVITGLIMGCFWYALTLNPLMFNIKKIYNGIRKINIYNLIL